jgi:comEA protein
MPSTTSTTSWTSGAPKWAAVIALGAASAAAIGWAIGRGGDSWRTPARASGPSQIAAAMPGIQQQPLLPRPDQQNAQPVATPQPTAAAQQEAITPIPTARLSSSGEPLRVAAPLRKLINVNTAGQGELELLPGIGPALAKRIIEHRTTKGAFKRVDDLDAVKGIGPKILERLRAQVTVE